MICIYHSVDLDGWCSAAIVKKWFLDTHINGVVYDNPYKGDKSIIAGKEDEDSLTFFGYTYGNEIPNLNAYDHVIMCDISFPKEVMNKIAETKHFVWIDHHISAINDNASLLNENNVLRPTGKRDVKFAACELTWEYFFRDADMPEFVRLLGRYDCFGHKGTNEEQKVLEFQYAARAYFKNPDDCLEMLRFENGEGIIDSIKTVPNLLNIGKGIYQYLCTEAIQEYKNIWPLEIGGFKFATINKQRFNPINFGINYHEDGYDGFACYWFANNKWNFSLYNDNSKVDCSEVCKKLGGGGHKGAAGFTCDTWCDHLGVLNVYTKPQ